MGLITKPPSWRFYSTGLSGTPNATGGVAFTAAANNADGTAVEVIPALTHDVEYLVIGIKATSPTGSVSDMLLDVLVDPAGGSAWVSLIDDLLAGGQLSQPHAQFQYHFPIWVPAGASIGVQARTKRTTDITTGVVFMQACGGNVNPASWWCGQRVTSVGIDAANSAGTAHTPGNSGAFSSWTNFGSTLPAACGALQFGVQANNNAAVLAVQYFVEFGVGSQRIGPTLYHATSSNEQVFRVSPGLIFNSLPSAAQMMVRGTCSGTAQSIQVAAYAVH